MPTFRKYYKFLFRHKKTILFSLSLVLISQIGENYSLYIFQYIFDVLSKPDFDQTMLNAVVNTVLIFTAIKLVSTLLHVVSWYFMDRAGLRAQSEARLEVLTRVHELDFSYHATKQSGALISVFKRGDAAFGSFNITLNQSLFRRFIDYVFFSVAFLALDWRFLILFLVIITLNILISWKLMKGNIMVRREFNDYEDELSGKIVDNIINYETVKLFAQEKWEQNRISGMLNVWYKKVMAYANSFRTMDLSMGILSLLGTFLSSLLAIYLFSTGEISIGQMSLVFAFVLTFFPKLVWFTYDVREIVKNMTDMQKYMSYLDLKSEVEEKSDAIDLKKVDGIIDFKNMSFNYKGRSKVFEDFSLHIDDGESVALVGYSGAGKSTLMKLLLRYYDPASGSIEIDNINIRDATKESLRHNIGLVPQEPILFNDTIGYNISYPNPNASPAMVAEAAKLANLDIFIGELPDKYNTIVGERGIKLSGGQKQRLAIARMFLADPQIIVFDEATSQLDSESEKLIQDAFWRIAKGKTTLIIAHRLSTVMKADRIVVIDKGKIVESGTHSSLIKQKSGIYSKLWSIQKGLMVEKPI